MAIGTGSGCIALALKNQIKKTKVSAVDVSEEALKVATRNAKLNGLEVEFILSDILSWESFHWGKYDLIVSNPPYVREVEKSEILPNVLNFEPSGALFVSDSDPFLFYRKIGEFAVKFLNPGGYLFFEINENLSEETVELLDKQGFKNITLKKDLQGKNRMVRCTK